MYIKEFFMLIKTQFQAIVKVFRSNNGGEFMISISTSLFKQLDIVHQTSCAYSPQHNRRVERKHRSLLDMAQPLRFQVVVLVRYWGYFVLTTCYLHNLLPSSTLKGKSPFEVLDGKAPSLQHLRVFGCLYFVKYFQCHDKFAPRSNPAVFMGYSVAKKVM